MADQDERPGHLPKGVWGWIVEHILWITLLAAAAAAYFLVIWAEEIFQ